MPGRIHGVIKRPILNAFIGAMLFCFCANFALADSALTVLGKDYVFLNAIEGLPAKLSDFKDLEINVFTTSDDVRLAYWEAGQGKPLVFIPGWSANGAEYVNVLYLLSKKYHVYVLDPRNQGLSQRVDYGNRISRYAVDLKEFAGHEGFTSADYCGWSMGASMLWSYVDLFGTKGIRKLAFIDEPISIYAHADWNEQERLDAGGMTSSPERMIRAFTQGTPVSSLIADMKIMERFAAMDSPYYQNSEGFAWSFIRNDSEYLKLILFDHVTNDWRDVIRHKIRVPAAIFTGEYSINVSSQKWMQSVIPGAKLYVYTKAEQGDHFLAFENPLKFTSDLETFLDQ
ncbi:Pimeloyl-ACP methyl ester carboxylesterase [Desulfomicrobium norvegicum]|uniref:Pimeloyl-ACP methyl ester carboxylesterase n=1 Tax=Desulfomicrobium norvegicum (strain DSM 1741 / NCIMB 8310) TaxID=52561 RepID=A0A8G2FFZ5_DESNO|nr:Pimeloyl-ACP methyl ester carboxylesterase [Desulfomicrobium norvegicum]